MSCSSNCLKTKSKNSLAIPAASMVLEQGARITPLVSPWSTMTMTESKPEEAGRLVMRSTESCLKGREIDDGIVQRGGMTGWVLTLFCWQTAHPAMKCFINVARPGHQKSCSRMALVQKTPMWPEREEEWTEWRRANCVEGGTNIQLRK